jgi:hypothetical protein
MDNLDFGHDLDTHSSLFFDDDLDMSQNWGFPFDFSCNPFPELGVSQNLDNHDPIAGCGAIAPSSSNHNPLTSESSLENALFDSTWDNWTDQTPVPPATCPSTSKHPPNPSHKSPEVCDIEENETCDSSSKKRRWNESIVVFASKPNVKVVPKRRKAFMAARKQEVARNRSIGACIQCKIRRGPVSLPACPKIRFANTSV